MAKKIKDASPEELFLFAMLKAVEALSAAWVTAGCKSKIQIDITAEKGGGSIGIEVDDPYWQDYADRVHVLMAARMDAGAKVRRRMRGM